MSVFLGADKAWTGVNGHVSTQPWEVLALREAASQAFPALPGALVPKSGAPASELRKGNVLTRILLSGSGSRVVQGVGLSF